MQAENEERENREEVLADYLERLNAGEQLMPEEVLFEHPTHGHEILEQLETFVGAESGEAPAPLGTLGDFTLRGQIGRGGMGVVYDAWQNSMKRRVALKVLPKAIALDASSVTRFVREAQVAGKLDHPCVVRVHSMGLEEQIP